MRIRGKYDLCHLLHQERQWPHSGFGKSSRLLQSAVRYVFLTTEGLELLGEASPGGAGRNRTLGLEALNAIEAPVPPPENQQWFDQLHAKAASARRSSAEAASELDHLIPAILNEVLDQAGERAKEKPLAMKRGFGREPSKVSAT
ncbi:hypothetical protein ACVME5_007447 [Bradyrhizobium liaoningense]